MIQLDGTCATEVVAGELVEGFEFEPRCLVIVTALENEKELFNAMISAGRPLTDPFEIQINYTIATGTEPDVKIASTNCHNSHVLLRNYELDTTNQDVRDELAQVRTDITMYENLIAFTQHVVNSQSLVGPADSWGRVTLLSPKPSPPPPPPPVAELAGAWAPRHPPAPPETVSGRVLITRYEGLLLDREARRDELVLKLSDCLVGDRAAGTVCGLTSNEARTTLKPISDAGASAPTNADVRPPPVFLAQAPDPWMALGGVKCRGYDTRSSREGDYCGCAQRAARRPHPHHHPPPHRCTARPLADWESDTNPMAAATKKERHELLSVGPFCMVETGELSDEGMPRHTVHYCSPNSVRTQRSGITDIKYMIRPDREYWLVCCNLNHTHTHVRIPHESHTGHPCFLLTFPPDPTQRVQVCAAADRRRVGRQHRAVPRQPHGALGPVRPQLRLVRGPLHQQDRDRRHVGRQVLALAAHPGHAASAALERSGAGARPPNPNLSARPTPARGCHASSLHRRTSASAGAPSATTCGPPTRATAGRRSTASSSRTTSTRPTRRATP